jgi:hypothetical protein
VKRGANTFELLTTMHCENGMLHKMKMNFSSILHMEYPEMKQTALMNSKERQSIRGQKKLSFVLFLKLK